MAPYGAISLFVTIFLNVVCHNIFRWRQYEVMGYHALFPWNTVSLHFYLYTECNPGCQISVRNSDFKVLYLYCTQIFQYGAISLFVTIFSNVNCCRVVQTRFYERMGYIGGNVTYTLSNFAERMHILSKQIY